MSESFAEIVILTISIPLLMVWIASLKKEEETNE
ncbi:hypothetical protein MED92_01164 [Oceanospirillum sp. MED92]|uniref:Uncharacterized protein n=1 Tax=Neptuniibacter caesariensis TaxID=207954 RepID=A0A7U8GRK1_NEPCE|nr:hypothetical protein MED92_01164 [Oceanospirillum sp. MED92] [Neptuniibacter caesariensis]